MKKNILLTVIFSVFVSACSQEVHYKRFEIEQDGEVRFVFLEEISELELHTPINADSIAKSREYSQIRENRITDYPDILERHKQVYEENNGLVDDERYPYVIEIPIKTKQLLQGLPQSHKNFHFSFGRCIDLNYTDTGSYIWVNQNPSFDGQYYHYKLVAESGELASHYLLSYVTDFCIVYADHKSDWDVDIDIESNNLKIDAEEIKNALNAVGILHE